MALLPDKYYSDETGEPFATCIECECVLESTNEYLIEKAYKRYPGFEVKDTVFEYALCKACYVKLENEMSEESRQALAQFFEQNINVEYLLSDGDFCCISGVDLSTVAEYQVAVLVNKHNGVYTELMFAGEAIDRVVEVLSEKTLDEIDGFVGRNLGLPPEFEGTPRPRFIIV